MYTMFIQYRFEYHQYWTMSGVWYCFFTRVNASAMVCFCLWKVSDLPPLNRSTNYVSQAALTGEEVLDERTGKRTTARRGIGRASGS